MSFIIKKWSALSTNPISEAAIRSLYPPEKKYRVSAYKYPPGASFSNAVGLQHLVFVVEGKFKYAGEGDEIIVGEAEFVSVEVGKYTCKVIGDMPVRLVKVFDWSKISLAR